MRRLVIRNGRVVDPAQKIDRVCDVAIEDGKIREIGTDIAVEGSEEFDASGLIVAPGMTASKLAAAVESAHQHGRPAPSPPTDRDRGRLQLRSVEPVDVVDDDQRSA